MAAICRSTIIKEGTPFTSEWSLRSLRNSHAVYVGIYIPFISEWLRRSAGICNFFDKDIAVDGNTANYYIIEEGDFVYNPRKSNTAPYGPFNRYNLSERGIISPLYTCLVLQADINPSYLAWYFRSDAWHRYIYDNGSQGVRHDRVSMTDDLLMGIPVMFPNIIKQQVYAEILDKIETRLQTAQKEYELLVSMKNGFAQQLFI